MQLCPHNNPALTPSTFDYNCKQGTPAQPGYLLGSPSLGRTLRPVERLVLPRWPFDQRRDTLLGDCTTQIAAREGGVGELDQECKRRTDCI